jgi:hypothetical protein
VSSSTAENGLDASAVVDAATAAARRDAAAEVAFQEDAFEPASFDVLPIASDAPSEPTDAPASRDAPDRLDFDTGADEKSDVTTIPPHLIFLTSSVYTGDLVGAANALLGRDAGSPEGGPYAAGSWKDAANAICQWHARRAGHSGTFWAVLSGPNDDITKRLSDADGPWAMVDGSPVAPGVSNLNDGPLLQPIMLTETGAAASYQQYGPEQWIWTGSTTPENSCLGWTMAQMQGPDGGEVYGSSHSFLDISAVTPSLGGQYCSSVQHLLCAEVGPGGGPLTLPKPNTNSKIAFYDDAMVYGDFASMFDAGADRAHAAADAHCQGAAATAGLQGTFRAWISSTNQSAVAYFQAHNAIGPWFRPDGFEVSESLALLVAGGPQVPIDLDASGAYRKNGFAWTGSTQGGGLCIGCNCQDYTTRSGSSDFGFSNWGGRYWSNISTPSCSLQAGLFCFQE